MLTRSGRVALFPDTAPIPVTAAYMDFLVCEYLCGLGS